MTRGLDAMYTKSRFRRILAASVLIGATTAGVLAPIASAQAASNGGTFVLGETIQPEQVTNFNPFLSTGNWINIFDYTYNALFYFNPVKGQLLPSLASGLGKWSTDHETYTVTLENGVTWQDGKPFSANDVVYTYNILKAHTVLDRNQLWGPNRLTSVTAKGNSVIFKTKQPFPSLPYYLSTVYIVAKHIFSKQDPTTFLNANPIGTGPFQLQSVNSSALNLTANENYFRSPPHISQLVIDRYNDAPTLTLALEKGDVQATAGTMAMPSLPLLMENSAVKLQVFPGLSVFSVIMNNDNPLLKDPVVRRAIQTAINRQALIQKGELGAVFPANPGFMPKVFGSMADNALFSNANYAFNIGRAEQWLSKDGYKKDSGGIFAKNGKELSFTYYMAANAPAQDKEGAMITQWLQQAGVKTTVKLATWPELTNLLIQGDYDLLQDSISFPPDPLASMEVFESSMTAPIGQTAPGLNYMRFRDKTVDKWLAQASVATNTAERTKLLYKIQERVAMLAPLAVMYNVGGHIPYRVDKFTNYDRSVPVYSAISLSHVEQK